MSETYNKLVLYIQKNGWQSVNQTDKYIFFKPPQNMGFPEGYTLPVPCKFNAPDYNESINFATEVVADFYETTPDKIIIDIESYLSILKQDALYIKLFSEDVSTGKVMGLDFISTFLKNLEISFENYVKIRFKKLFGDRYSNTKSFNKFVTALVSNSKLKFVDLQYQSFSFGVSVDNLMGINSFPTKEMKSWRSQVLHHYDEQVLIHDLNSPESLEQVLELFPLPEERKAIFDPIVKCTDSDQYKIQVTDRNYSPRKVLKAVKPRAKKEIFPISLKEPDQEGVEYRKVIIPVSKSSSGSTKKVTINQEQIENTLFSSPVNEILLHEASSSTERLLFPYELSLKLSAEGTNPVLYLEEFDIRRKSATLDSVAKLINFDLLNLYHQWASGTSELRYRGDFEQLDDFFSACTLEQKTT